MTKEELKRKQKHNEYVKWWNKNKGKESYKKYQKEYYKAEKEREFGYYLYYLIKDSKIIWVGSTENMYRRMHNHKSTKDFDKILYKDLTYVVRDRSELEELEYYFIDYYREEVINKDKKEIKISEEKYFKDMLHRYYLTELKEYVI